MALHIFDGRHIGLLGGGGYIHLRLVPADAITPDMVPKPRSSMILDDSYRPSPQAGAVPWPYSGKYRYMLEKLPKTRATRSQPAGPRLEAPAWLEAPIRL